MIPVILSGGSGTRLWPVSRASYPKQFCEFYDRSFLQNTIERSKKLGTPYLLTVKSMEGLSLRIANQSNIPADHILLEPLSKNTAPAVALLCHILATRGFSKEVVGLFPSDHLIADTEAFSRALKLGDRVARSGKIVTLGIPPVSAVTGYGYIQKGDNKLDGEAGLTAYAIQAFKEKPDAARAEEYLKSGQYSWNAGIFVQRGNDDSTLPEIAAADLGKNIAHFLRFLQCGIFVRSFALHQFGLRDYGKKREQCGHSGRHGLERRGFVG